VIHDKHILLRAPTGAYITGTLETVQGVAGISAVTLLPSGAVDVDYDGYTKIDWDSQRTATDAAGNVIYVDENDDEWTLDQLTVEDAPDD
jgi:hypothetical protein